MNPKAWVEAVVELIWRIGLRLVLWVALGYFLFRVRSIVAAVIIAAVLTYAVIPIVDFLCAYRVRGMGRKLQRFVATFLVFILLASLTVIVTTAFFTPFHAELVGLVEKFDLYGEQARMMATSAHKWYVALPPDVQKFLGTQDFKGVVEGLTKWANAVVKTTIDLVSHLLGIILIPVLAFYFTLDSRVLKREFVALVPRSRTREALALLHEMNSVMRSYVIGQIILCVIAGVVVGLFLKLLDMQYVLILSVFAGVTRAVPVIGPIVSGAAIVLLGVIKSPLIGLYLLVFFALLHFTESKFIMPKLIGHRMQLHPAIIIVALLIGAEFFGILGMFMAAPVTAIVRVFVRYYFIKPRKLRVWGLSHANRDSAMVDMEKEPDSDTLAAAPRE